MHKPIYAATALLVLGTVAPSIQAQSSTKPFRVEKDLVYTKAGDVELKLDAYLPEDDEETRPAILVVHGGAWRSGSKSQLAFYAAALARRGYSAFAINYRLAPEFQFPAQIEDCRAAVRWIKGNAEKYSVDIKRVGAIGYSAGGHLVTLLACTSHDERHKETAVQAVVAGGAPCDFRQTPELARGLSFWLGGSRKDVPKIYRTASPAAFVSESAPPMFFFHGEEDRLVKPDSPRAMVTALKAEKVEASLHIVPEGGHIGAAIDGEALSKAWKFFDQQLKKSASGASTDR